MISECDKPKENKYMPFDMMVTIVNRDEGERVVECNKAFNIPVNVVCHGRGTADSHWLDILGVGTTEKDIVLSFVPVENARLALDNLIDKLDLHARGKGIAFTVNVNSVAGASVLHYFTDAGAMGGKE